MQLSPSKPYDYMALCNEPPLRLDSGMIRDKFKIPKGDLLQKIYIWREEDSQNIQKADKVVVPLRDIVNGTENAMICLTLNDIPCRLTVAQKKSPESEKTFQDKILDIKNFIRSPQSEETEPVAQKINIHSYKAVINWTRNNISRDSISAEITECLLLASYNNNVLRLHALSSINQRYKKKKILGRGTRGDVYQVKTLDGDIRALKFTQELDHPINPPFQQTATIINHLIDTEETIHLTRIYYLFKMNLKKHCPAQNDSFEDSVKDDEDTFTVEDLNIGKLSEKFDIVELECMDGDVDSLCKESKLSPLDTLAIRIQLLSVLQVLGKYHIEARDIGLQNVMFKELNESDTFKGKRLLDYDYWKYAFGDKEVYIPRMKYLIKMCDYDQWYSRLFAAYYKAKQPSIDKLSEEHFEGDNPLNESGLEQYPKPADPMAKILTMN